MIVTYVMCYDVLCFFFFQAEDGIRDAQESRGLGDVYKRQRYGGDEICVLLIEGDAITAVRVAERIRHAVRDKPFLCSAGETQVTLSLGVATLDPTEDSLERLIERADRALYQAKRRGRDRVVVR